MRTGDLIEIVYPYSPKIKNTYLRTLEILVRGHEGKHNHGVILIAQLDLIFLRDAVGTSRSSPRALQSCLRIISAKKFEPLRQRSWSLTGRYYMDKKTWAKRGNFHLWEWGYTHTHPKGCYWGRFFDLGRPEYIQQGTREETLQEVSGSAVLNLREESWIKAEEFQ